MRKPLLPGERERPEASPVAALAVGPTRLSSPHSTGASDLADDSVSSIVTQNSSQANVPGVFQDGRTSVQQRSSIADSCANDRPQDLASLKRKTEQRLRAEQEH